MTTEVVVKVPANHRCSVKVSQLNPQEEDRLVSESIMNPPSQSTFYAHSHAKIVVEEVPTR